MRPSYRIITIVLSLAGMAVMAYLTALHYAGNGSAFCDLSQELSCSFVNQSRYAEVAGIPMAILGIITFAAVLALAVSRNALAIALLTLFSVIPSLYLSVIEFFVLRSICIFCEIAKVILLAIFVVAVAALRAARTPFPWRAAMGVVFVGIVATAGTYLLQRPRMVQDYTAFAQCLAEKGFVMYGSVTCGACAKQRAMFGDAFQYIAEIECDPRNPNPETERCIAKAIEKTPTWIQEDTNGKEQYRFSPGVQSLAALRDASGCALGESL